MAPGFLSWSKSLRGAIILWDTLKGPPSEPRSQEADRGTRLLVYLGDWLALLAALDSRKAGVMVEAKGKEQALAPLGVGIE